jgi:hypothetical protein
VQEIAMGQNAPRVGDQDLEEVELRGGEPDLGAVQDHLPAVKVDT